MKTSHTLVLTQPSGFWKAVFLNHVGMMKNLPGGSCVIQILLKYASFVN